MSFAMSLTATAQAFSSYHSFYAVFSADGRSVFLKGAAGSRAAKSRIREYFLYVRNY